jgi:WD40 repeat protein
MPVGQTTAAEATAAVFGDGRRVGSAVLVTPRYLVTAAHVLLRRDSGTGTRVPAVQIEVEFPSLVGERVRLAASCLDLNPAGAAVDVAVLDLGEDRPTWLPAPVPVWPAVRPPADVEVFGYPLAEGPLNGVWRRFVVAGPSAAGAVQLGWLGDAGTFPGHSGGPVIDVTGHSLAGILVEGAERGRFDRYLPVTLIARVWPQLPRPWLMTGANPGEARSHFTRRARGQRSAARGGDLFRGRSLALDRIGSWLTADEPSGQALVITGQPGAGKSAVLARAALGLEARNGGPGLAFHARAATCGDFLTALADLTGIETPNSLDDLIASLAALPARPSIPVAVDALDEAASDRDRRLMVEAVAELAMLSGLRVAVASRPLAVGNPYALGGLLAPLGVTGHDAPNLVDLDSDEYFDLEGLYEFAAALLAQGGMDRPAPPGAAWTQYRINHAVRDRLAMVIAERAGRNFLVAAMAAVPLSTAREIIDPIAVGFDLADIPSGVGEGLSKYLDHLPEERRQHDRALLTALAYARGAGLLDQMWLAFAAALGYDARVADLDILRRSAAADYLLQTISTEQGTRPVTRLFHQALADELLAARHRPSDESCLLDIIVGQAGRTGWQESYARDHAAEHAAAIGRLDQLLEDPHYLISVVPARLVPHLDAVRSTSARAAAAVYRQSAHHLVDLDRPERASQLELSSHHLGDYDLAVCIAGAVPNRPWQTHWSHGRRAIGYQVLVGHGGDVSAVAVGALPDGSPVIVSGSYDGTVRVWRLADGTPVGEPLLGHGGGVSAVAVGALPDGTPVIVSGDNFDGTVRVWRLADGTPVREPLFVHGGGVSAVAVGALPDGTPVIVTGDYIDGTVRVWRLGDGTPVGQPITGDDVTVGAMAVGALPDDTPVIVTGSDDGTMHLWRLADGTALGEPLRGHDEPVTAMAVARLPDGTPVIVSGSYDRTVRVWRLADGTPVGKPMHGHTGLVSAVAVGALPDGTSVIVSGADFDGTVRVWRLADGTPVGEPLYGHGLGVSAVAVGALPDGSPVIVSGGDFQDRTVRVWRLADSTAVGEPLHGHDERVTAVAVARLPDGSPVIVSGSYDRTVRVWRLADGTPVGKPMHGHTGTVTAVAVARLRDGTPVIVSGGNDGTVLVWRLADGTPVGKLVHGRTGMVTAVAVGALPDGTPVIVSGGDDGAVRVWRLIDGSPVGKSLYGHTGMVTAVAVGGLPDGTPVIVSGGSDRTVRAWRLAHDTMAGQPLYGSTRHRLAGPLAAARLPDGTPVIVSSDGATVRVWRLADGIPVGKPITGRGRGVSAVASGALPDDTPVIVSGSYDGAVRVWQLADGSSLASPLYLPEDVTGVAVHGNLIITAAGADIAVHQPKQPRPMP